MLEAIRHRIAVHAGLRPERAAMQFRGNLEYVGTDLIEGWAQTPSHPDVPVCLDIYVEDVLVMQVLANRHRGDLVAAGIGRGSHAFVAVLPAPVTSRALQTVEVRRSSDGALLPCNKALSIRAA